MNSRIAVLLPCYNEEVTIKKVVKDFRKELPEADIYVFDNNSKDNTAKEALAAKAIVVKSPKQGKGFVIQHMFRCVEADYYVMADGDDTYPAKSVHRLLEAAKQNHTDMVVGTRLKKFETGSFRLFHQFGNHLVAKMISILFGTKINDVLSGYRVFSRDIVKTLPLTSGGFDIETEMTLQALSKDFTVEEIPVEYGERPEGSFSKLNTYRDGVLVLRAIAMIFKDYRPLVFYSLLSLFFAILALCFGSIPIMDYIREQYVSHIPLAILASGLSLFSVIFLTCGLILDTIVRFHHENFQMMRKKKYKKDF